MRRFFSSAPLIWRLALRDLRGSFRAVRIFMLCIALGVAAIAVIGAFQSSIRAGIAHNAKAILGGDIELSQPYTPFPETLREHLAAHGTPTRSSTVRAMVDAVSISSSPSTSLSNSDLASGAPAPNKRLLAEIKAIEPEHYPLYGTLNTEPTLPIAQLFSKNSAGQFGVAVEAGLLERMGLRIGDSLRIGAAEVEIRARIVQEPDRVMTPFTLGPRVMMGMDAFALCALEQPGSLVEQHLSLRLHPQENAPSIIAQLRADFPNAGWRIRTPEEAALGVQRTLDRLALFLSLTGLMALVTGGIGIANAVAFYMERKQTTLAILKSLGAHHHHVSAIYTLQIMLLSVVASLVGALCGMGLQLLILGWFGEYLPIQAEAGFYIAPFITAIAFGVTLSLVFSLPAIWQVIQVRPTLLFRGAPGRLPRIMWHRARIATLGILLSLVLALAIFFTGNVAVTLWFVLGLLLAFWAFAMCGMAMQRLAQRAAHCTFPVHIKLALHSLTRPGATTVSIVMALGVGVALMVTLALVSANLQRQIGEDVAAKAPSFFMIDIQPDQQNALREAVLALPGAEDLQEVPIIRGRIVAIQNVPVAEVNVSEEARWAVQGDRGFTASATPPEGNDITAGSWWPAEYQADGTHPPLISLDEQLAKGFGVKPGDTLTLSILGREITATIANTRKIDWSSLHMNFAIVFSPGVLDAAPKTFLASIRVPPSEESRFLDLLAKDFPNISTVRVRDTLQQVKTVLGHMANVVFFTSALALLVGALVIASAISATLERRAYETVVLKVLGASRRNMLAMFSYEFLLLAAAASLIALLIGIAGAYGIMQLMVFKSFSVDVFFAAAVVISAIMVTLLLGNALTWHTLASRPLAMLRNE